MAAEERQSVAFDSSTSFAPLEMREDEDDEELDDWELDDESPLEVLLPEERPPQADSRSALDNIRIIEFFFIFFSFIAFNGYTLIIKYNKRLHKTPLIVTMDG